MFQMLQRVLLWQSHPVCRRGQRSERPQSRPIVESLERRELMSIDCDLDLASGLLIIEGNDNSNAVSIEIDTRGTNSTSDDRLSVIDIAGATDRCDFDVDDVSSIVVLLRGADDLFANGTLLPVEVYGGSGDDHIWGGGGSDSLRGGTGDDELWGMSGADQLFGNDGLDTLHGGRHNDILDGGYDDFQDKLYGDGGRDTFVEHHSVDCNWLTGCVFGYRSYLPERYLDFNATDGDVIQEKEHRD